MDILIIQDKNNIIIMFIVSEYQFFFARTAKQTRKSYRRLAFLPVFKSCTNKLYIFTTVYIYYYHIYIYNLAIVLSFCLIIIS